MNNVIRLNKLTKILGIITSAIFGLIVLGLLVSGNIVPAMCFLPFVALGLCLILAYIKQKIIINEDELVFSYLVKKTQHVKYDDIKCILLIPLSNRTQIALVDKNYNRIATLDILAADYEALFVCLAEKNIEIVDFSELVEEGKDVSNYMRTLNWLERTYYKSMDNEDETVERMSKTQNKEEVTKTKQKLKILGWVLIFADVLAYFLSGKAVLIVFTAVLLVTYALYVKYYPYIYIETKTKNGEDQAYQLPFMGAAMAMLFSINLGRFYNYDFISYMKMVALVTVLLLIPFFMKSSKTDVRQGIARKLSVVFAAFLIAFSVTFSINFMLTFDGRTHEDVVVTGKNITGGRLRDRELYVDRNGEREIYSVTRSEYEDASIGDEKRICIRKSIIGLEYSTLHD